MAATAIWSEQFKQPHHSVLGLVPQTSSTTESQRQWEIPNLVLWYRTRQENSKDYKKSLYLTTRQKNQKDCTKEILLLSHVKESSVKCTWITWDRGRGAGGGGGGGRLLLEELRCVLTEFSKSWGKWQQYKWDIKHSIFKNLYVQRKQTENT